MADYVDKKDTVTYTQSTPATTWTAVHNLGTVAPKVDVWVNVDGQVVAMVPKNIHVDDVNTITVTFSTAQSGSLVIQ